MAITHVLIDGLPNSDFVTATINGGPIVINQLYPIADTETMEFLRTALAQNLSLRETIKWKAYDQSKDIYSNSAVVTVEWKYSAYTSQPVSQSASITILNTDNVNLLQEITIDGLVEFIDIESISGSGTYKLSGQTINAGQRILAKDLHYTVFSPEVSGGGTPYSELSFKVGNANEVNPEVYVLSMDIASSASIAILSGPTVINYQDTFDNAGVPTEYNVTEQAYSIEIVNGQANVSGEIQVVINSPFLSLNTYNKVIFDIGSEEIEIFANETFLADIVLDNKGRGALVVTNYIVNDSTVAKNGQIDITLTSINGDVALVNATSNTVQLITSL